MTCIRAGQKCECDNSLCIQIQDFAVRNRTRSQSRRVFMNKKYDFSLFLKVFTIGMKYSDKLCTNWIVMNTTCVEFHTSVIILLFNSRVEMRSFWLVASLLFIAIHFGSFSLIIIHGSCDKVSLKSPYK